MKQTKSKDSARNQLIFMGLIVGFAVLTISACGGAGTTSTAAAPGTSSVAVFGGDAPVCDVVSFMVTITSATLTPDGGGTPVSIISSASPVTVDFAALMDFFTVLNFASVPTGKYSSLTLTLSSPQLTVLDVTTSPPSTPTIPTTLTASTVTLNIDPELEVGGSGSAGLNIDFRLRKSVLTDSTGQVTGTVNPMFRVSATTPEPENGLGEDGDLKGVVQSVTTTSSSSSFVGSFVVQNDEAQNFTVQVTSTTEFDDLSGLSNLMVGAFAEVEAFVDSSGNIVAKEVEAEGDDEQEQRSAFTGFITSVVRSTAGNVTQFNLFVRGEEPDESACVPRRTTVTVNVSSDAEFHIAARMANPAGLSFDSTTVMAGQHVVVHGQCVAGTPPSINAGAVFLRKQTILGNFATLLAASSDNKTGGFTLTPCGAVLGGQPITVFTFSGTDFVNVTGLNGLMPTLMMAVRGLLLYEQNAITVNTITTTAPAAVFEAVKVHQPVD